jgi:hypothetical protein
MEVTSCPSFETVIITYNKHFVELQNCLQSIIDHGLGHNTELVHIIVNDTKQHFDKVSNFVPNDPRFRIWHYEQIDPWQGPLDWVSQQWFKLVASKIVTSEWYLVLDSDIVLHSPIRHNNMFKDNRAYYRKTAIDYTNTRLVKQLSNAYEHWNEQLDDWKYFMSDLTPFMLHTDTVKNMLPKVDSELYNNPTTEKIILEFHLWSAYLDHAGIKDQLYCPIANPWSRLFNTLCP